MYNQKLKSNFCTILDFSFSFLLKRFHLQMCCNEGRQYRVSLSSPTRLHPNVLQVSHQLLDFQVILISLLDFLRCLVFISNLKEGYKFINDPVFLQQLSTINWPKLAQVSGINNANANFVHNCETGCLDVLHGKYGIMYCSSGSLSSPLFGHKSSTNHQSFGIKCSSLS